MFVLEISNTIFHATSIDYQLRIILFLGLTYGTSGLSFYAYGSPAQGTYGFGIACGIFGLSFHPDG